MGLRSQQMFLCCVWRGEEAMSRTMNLGCVTCKESIWIGQSDIIYTAEPHTMEALRVFLVKHRTDPQFNGDDFDDHHLVYMPDLYYDDWVEIDTDIYKKPEDKAATPQKEQS